MIRLLGAGDLKNAHFSFRREGMDRVGAHGPGEGALQQIWGEVSVSELMGCRGGLCIHVEGEARKSVRVP